MAKSDNELTAEIIAAYLNNPSIQVKAEYIPELIEKVHDAVSKLC